MTNHTPGPWIVCELSDDDSIFNIEQDRSRVSSEPSIVASVDLMGDGVDREVGTANANLIAAAPDLLAACRAWFAGKPTVEVREMMRAAIANAEGLTP